MVEYTPNMYLTHTPGTFAILSRCVAARLWFSCGQNVKQTRRKHCRLCLTSTFRGVNRYTGIVSYGRLTSPCTRCLPTHRRVGWPSQTDCVRMRQRLLWCMYKQMTMSVGFCCEIQSNRSKWLTVSHSSLFSTKMGEYFCEIRILRSIQYSKQLVVNFSSILRTNP